MLTADQAREMKWLREKEKVAKDLCEQGAEIVSNAIVAKHQADLKLMEAMHYNNSANSALMTIRLQIEYLEACNNAT